jgi:hypothetical protein
MIVKKMLLLAGSAMALVAFAVPAAAHASTPEWLTEGAPIAGEDEIHVEGEFSWLSYSGFTVGPCEVTLEGAAKNENAMAAGSITGGSVVNSCLTNKAGCEAKEVTLNFGADWAITGATVTGVEGVEITGVRYITHFNSAASCGLPIATFLVTGTVTGTVTEGGECISLENHSDDLSALAGLFPVDLEGFLCSTNGLTLG